MKRPAIFPLLLLSLAAAGCGGRESDSASLERRYDSSGDAAEAVLSMEAAPTAPPAASNARPDFSSADTVATAVDLADGEPAPIAAAVSLNPMLIRTGQAVLRVDSLEEGIGRVRRLAQQVGGIVGNTAITGGSEEARRAEIELRIPSSAFDRAINGLAPIGEVQSVNVTAEDVGEEYTDVSARVANARRLEARLLTLLDTRSGRLEEVLNLEREVARVREEIERHEGRLRYLRTRASISVLTVTLHEGDGVIRSSRDNPIPAAFGIAWRSFIDLVAGFIASLGILIPLLLAAWVAWRAFRWIRRRDAEKDAAWREALRRERERAAASAAPANADEPARIV